MSFPDHCEVNEFQLVKSKRSKKVSKVVDLVQSTSETEYNKEKIIRACKRIEEAIDQIRTSDIFISVLASLREGLVSLGNPVINEIICFGLGKISECMVSKYQFALLLCLKELHKTEIQLYDPIFNDNDLSIIGYFNCSTIANNFEGKFKIKNNLTTIFYLPHCPKQLTNNLLWANWGLNLNYCIIISNSFNYICENTPSRMLENNAEFIKSIAPYATELAIVNNFKFFEIFNDTSIHIFPWEKLKLISSDFWTYLSEPKYLEKDIEFITITNKP